MSYEEIIATVASSLGLSKSMVDKVYKSYWKAIREHVTSMPFKEDLSDEEFQQLRPNVNIPSIGKLYVTLDRYKRVKKHAQILKDIRNNKQDNNVTHQEN